MRRSTAACVLASLFVLALLPGTQIAAYVGPSDGSGTVPLTPPTEAEMQKMIDERLEKHACMHKSGHVQDMMDAADTRYVAFYPSPNQYDYDILFYKIDIEVVIDSEFIDGYVEVTSKSLVDGLNYIDLNLVTELDVTSVRRGDISLGFSHTTDALTINLGTFFNTGDVFTVRIEYNGHPPTYWGMFFDEYEGHPVCYTSCEPWGSRGWWPCKDFPFDKADSAEIIVEHPDFFGPRDIDCISNGLLLSKVGDGTTFTSRWFERHPIATYLVSLSISDYSRVNQTWEYAPGQTMPVEQNFFPGVPPDDPSGSTYFMVNYTIPSLDALSYYFGLYPFYDEKYGHSQWVGGGAMEHQTSTTIAQNFNTEYVIAHELGHQWAGDNVTCKDFHHIWLNEGFASYTEVLHFEYNYGWYYAHSWLMSQAHIDAGTPYVENFETDNIFDHKTVYDKGSWLVHMLRRQMGDSLFIAAMQDYFLTSEYAGGSATTEELCSLVSGYYGSDMSWFFDAWVYQAGQPNYKYSFTSETDTEKSAELVTLVLEQENMDRIFPMNVDIVAHAGSYDSSFTVWNGNQVDVYQFLLPGAPTYFEIDPDDHILKTVEYVPFSMRIAVSDVPDGFLDYPYEFTFQAAGGIPGYYWEHVAGELPNGLSLHNATGEISGTPESIGDFSFTIRCTDSDSPPVIDEREFSMSVTELVFTRGDCDGSGGIDIDDVVFLINYIFSGGPAPDPIESGDADCSGEVDIDDATYLIAYIFLGGPPPPEVC